MKANQLNREQSIEQATQIADENAKGVHPNKFLAIWNNTFDRVAKSLGLVYTGHPCSCPKDGEFGHVPGCGMDIKGEPTHHES